MEIRLDTKQMWATFLLKFKMTHKDRTNLQYTNALGPGTAKGAHAALHGDETALKTRSKGRSHWELMATNPEQPSKQTLLQPQGWSPKNSV